MHIFDISNIDVSMKKVEQVIFYTLDRSIKTYRQLAQSRLSESKLDITVDQWLVMNVVKEDPGCSHQDISDRVFKDNASVTRMIELLVNKGFMKRVVSKGDRRKTLLAISPSGKRLMSSASRVVESYRKAALKGISAAELEKTRRVLEKITANCHKN